MADTQKIIYVYENWSGDTLALNVSEEDNSISLDLAIETASYYDISKSDAKRMAAELTSAVRGNWERLALEHGLSRGAVEYMRPAFSACYEGNK